MVVEPGVNLNVTVLARASKKKKRKNVRVQCSHVKISMTTIGVCVFRKVRKQNDWQLSPR